MVLSIRDVTSADLEAVLRINNAVSDYVSSLDSTQLHHLFKIATYFRVIEMDHTLAGFLIALHRDCSYADKSFAWLQQHNDDFLFIDRIAVTPDYHRHGLGRILYADVQSYAEPRTAWLATAVILGLKNDAAVLFHGARGFYETAQIPVGSQHLGLLHKKLACHAYIKTRYGQHLPQVAWLEERHHS